MWFAIKLVMQKGTFVELKNVASMCIFCLCCFHPGHWNVDFDVDSRTRYLISYDRNNLNSNLKSLLELEIENPVYIVEKDESVCKLEWVSDNKRKQYVNCYIHIDYEY